MAELVAGGIIGVVFAELYKVAVELGKSMMFQPVLGQLTTTLDSLDPLIQQMGDLDRKLKLTSEAADNLQDEILKGLVLVRKCVKCSKFAIPKRIKYKKKLVKLDEFLKRLLETLKTEEMRDVKLNLLLTTEVSEKVDEMANDVKEILLGTMRQGGLLDEMLQDEKENLELVRKHSDQLDQLAKEDKQFRNVVMRNIVVKKHPKESGLFNRNMVMASSNSSLPVGLDEPLKALKTKLFEDGESMLVLTGPQGCGKTTLAKQFCKEEDVKGTFDNNIFFVLVSKKISWELIVQQLNSQYKNSELPNNIDDEEIAVEWLQQFLNEAGKNPLLLVLDDVWPGAEFLLEKFNDFKMLNYKILVTSIFEFPGFVSRYYVKPLNDKDAMTLFQHSVSGDRSSSIPADLAMKIVERCRGFPLAIDKCGRLLCDQPIEFWHKSVRNWCENSSILDSETNLFGSVQSSIDTLGKNKAIIQECFMDLGSFPENQKIPVAALIDIWAVLYKFEEDSQSIANIYELTNQNLANHIFTRKEKMDVDGYYNEHFVTQHYMCRQLAIYQAHQKRIRDRKRLIIDICANSLPKWLIQQKNHPVKARLLSISTDNGMLSMEWPNMQLPEVEVLIFNFQTKNHRYALPGFVENIEKLQVLIVTNYGSSTAELRKIDGLLKLSHLTRIRLQNISVASISEQLLAMRNLQKISLYMCSISEDFNSNGIRISDPLPNLVEMNIDHCNDLVALPDILCRLISLKKLSITCCDDLSSLPVWIGKLVKLELLRLRSCKDLLKLPESIGNLKQLNLLDLSDCSSLKKLPEHIGDLSNLRKLNMRHSKGLEKLPCSVLDLNRLEEVVCDEVTEKLWDPFLAKLSIKVIKEDM